ncbi:MAG: hypothetical protein B6D65_05695 [candidate division Zixibacteria bacterium 4484_93]|nr:MAG: hypothetical protein B6D65_05695 [candidate division Zixibacteria bacterium 4484_93]
MNRFQHLSRIAYHYIKKSVILPYPPYLYTIEPTNICNFACSFCPQSDPKHKFEREQGYLSVENYKLFLKKRNALSPGNRNSSLTLDGEPLLNPNFVELVAITNEFGLTPRFSSNARLLYPNITDELAKAGGFSISVDFASEEEIFERIRGRKGDFERKPEIPRRSGKKKPKGQGRNSRHLNIRRHRREILPTEDTLTLSRTSYAEYKILYTRVPQFHRTSQIREREKIPSLPIPLDNACCHLGWQRRCMLPRYIGKNYTGKCLRG